MSRPRASPKSSPTASKTSASTFNKAGGNIGKLENYLPQFHNPTAVLRAGMEKWRDDITPLLDRNRMVDPLSGAPMTDERLNETLGVARRAHHHGRLVRSRPGATPFGLGALVNQRQEHRFLHFKTDNDEWLTYDKMYGKGGGDPIQAVLITTGAWRRTSPSWRCWAPIPTPPSSG